jgi:hypothetical protein
MEDMQQVFDRVGGEVASPEIVQHFLDRTDRHVRGVQQACARLVASFPDLGPLLKRAQRHDASKYEEPERTPYIWLIWRYKCKDDGMPCVLPAGMEAQIAQATVHHILGNAHHPESHQGRVADLLNPADRDMPPGEVVDATGMGRLDIAEMVADWASMGAERGNTVRAWADRNVNVRWRFTPQQVRWIDAMIAAVEG